MGNLNDPQHTGGDFAVHAGQDGQAADLRWQAEAIARTEALPAERETLSADETRQLLHELRICRIELELQNEALRRAQLEIELSRERYFELYALAPVGYCTLTEKGVIREANLTAEKLLGVARGTLIEQPICRFIVREDQIIYYLHRKQLFASGERQACELRMLRHGGNTFWARMEANLAQDEHGKPAFRVMISEITDRKQAEARLQLAACVFSHAREGIIISDPDGTIVEVNRAFSRITGYSRDEAVGRNVRFLASDRQDQAFYAAIRRALNKEGFWCGEVWNQRKNGEAYAEMQTMSAVPDAQGNIRHVVTLISDVTERRQLEDDLREQKDFFRLIAENLNGFISVLDIDGRRLYNSPSYTQLVGNRNLAGTLSFLDVHPNDRERVIDAFRDAVATGVGQHLEFRFLTASGETRVLESRSGVIRGHDGRSKRVVVVSHDVTERKAAEERIRQLAFCDGLTQLPNRLTLMDRLSQALAASKRRACYGALMFIDLDNFKPLNDSQGHEAGDLLLIEVAERLTSCLREMDTVARFGGDEFVVMIPELDAGKDESTQQAAIIAEKIRRCLAEPYRLTIQAEGESERNIEHRCSASIGVALFSDHAGGRDEVVHQADVAMYRAKEAGRNLIRFHGAAD